MRIALAIVMVLHGFAHLVGFAGAWQIAPDGFPYKTTVLAGHVDLGDVGIRIVGALWLLTSIAFMVAGVSALINVDWWPQLALLVAAASLVVSVAEMPEARIGVAINVALIATLVIGHRLTWF